MTDTTLQNAETHTPAAPRRPPMPATPRLLFADGDSASKWAKTLSFMPISQAQQAMVGQLHALAAADLSARERAKIAEILREQVGHLHTELARRYAGKPQPEGERETEAIDQAIALWQALWQQYSTLLKPLIEGDAELQGVKAKILQRGLFVGKQLVVVYGLARRAMPGSVWHELHAYYRLAEVLDCAVTAVTDEQMPFGVGTSCYSTYSHALLLALADPCAMSVRQIELTDRWLGQWSRKLFPYAQQRESEGPAVIVDLDSASGALLAPFGPKAAPSAFRFGYPGKLATSVRGRLKRLAAGANPGELQLGQDVSVEQCVALLSHLEARWWHVGRPASDDADESLEIATGGLLCAFFRVGGRTFEREEKIDRTFHGAQQHLKSLAALTHYDRHKEEAERDWPWEKWHGRYEWRDASMKREDDGRYRWSLEQLIVAKDDERTRLGFASRVERGPAGELALALKLWPGTPRALTMRPVSTSMAEEAPLPAILLAESPEDRATVVMQPRAFTPGRVLRSTDAGPERKFRLTRLVQRGADFERVAFEDL
jgi:cyclic-di-GMP-binding protein